MKTDAEVSEILRRRCFKEFGMACTLGCLKEVEEGHYSIFKSKWHGVWWLLHQLSEDDLADIELDFYFRFPWEEFELTPIEYISELTT